MRSKKEPGRSWQETAAEMAKNRSAISQLANSEEAQKLMSMLRQQGGVQEAADAAAGGDPAQLLAMMDRLMKSKEGAQLVDQIGEQAKKAGLK